MRLRYKVAVWALLALAGAMVASAQFGMAMRQPRMQGFWNPVVGSGAAYEVENKGDRGEDKTPLEIAVVGSETVEGRPGYWLEYAVNDRRGGGPMYMKHLIVLDGKQVAVRRMIIQPSGQQPMELPADMMNRDGRTNEQPADIRDRAELVGTESITTLAGTFSCQHYRMKDGSGDVWVSEKITPWELVKFTGRDTNMTLVRMITDARTHITGTPQKFDPAEMMRRRNPQ